MTTPLCPYCGSASVLRDSSVIYGRSYGMAYVCSNYPACDAYVGCHKGDNLPLGRLANRELREAKKAAHAAFDTLWQSGRLSRTGAYRWLSRQLGLAEEETHIGMFDVEQCRRVVEACRKMVTVW